MQDVNKVLLGSTQSSAKTVTNHRGVIDAGIVVRLKSDDTLSIAKADGEILGVSLGKDQSDAGRTAICRKGLRVPLKLTTGFDPVIGAAVEISDTTGLAVTSGGTTYNAVYATGRIGGTGVNGGIPEFDPNGAASVGVAYIDFPGGL